MANGAPQQIGQDPAPAGKDTSPAPAGQESPAASGPASVIRTGFPEAVTPEPAPKPSADGIVRLATVPPLGSVTVPPLDEGGPTAVITRDGTEVDETTAERALAAAQSGGYKLVQI